MWPGNCQAQPQKDIAEYYWSLLRAKSYVPDPILRVNIWRRRCSTIENVCGPACYKAICSSRRVASARQSRLGNASSSRIAFLSLIAQRLPGGLSDRRTPGRRDRAAEGLSGVTRPLTCWMSFISSSLKAADSRQRTDWSAMNSVILRWSVWKSS